MENMEYIESKTKFTFLKGYFLKLRIGINTGNIRRISDALSDINRTAPELDTSVMMWEVEQHGFDNPKYIKELYRRLRNEKKKVFDLFRDKHQDIRKAQKGT